MSKTPVSSLVYVPAMVAWLLGLDERRYKLQTIRIASMVGFARFPTPNEQVLEDFEPKIVEVLHICVYINVCFRDSRLIGFIKTSIDKIVILCHHDSLFLKLTYL
jgi:hypothetical protein